MKEWILVLLCLIAGVALESSCAHAEYQFPKANSVYRSGSYPLASCKSWNGTITEISGADTSKAVMRGVVTEEDFKEFCERQLDPSASDAPARIKDCLANSIQLHRGETVLMSTADCRAGLIRNHDEKAYQLLGPQPSFHNFSWRHMRSGQILDGSCASGAPPISEQFKLLCPSVSRRILATVNRPQPSGAEGSTKPWIGRWHLPGTKACAGVAGESEDLLVYTSKEMKGYESTCTIGRAVQKGGGGTELSLLCEGEGQRYRDKETVDVVNGQLKRTVLIEGRRKTFTYTRCP